MISVIAVAFAVLLIISTTQALNQCYGSGTGGSGIFPIGTIGNRGDIKYSAFDMDTSGKMIVAGSCQDDNLCGGSNKKALMEYIDSTGTFLWSKYVRNSDSNQFTIALKFQPDGTSFVVAIAYSSNDKLFIAKVTSSNGATSSILKYDNSDSVKIFPQSLLFDSVNKLYVAMNRDDKWVFFKVPSFPASGSTTCTFFQRGVSSMSNGEAYSATMNEISTGAYITGTAKVSGNRYYSMHTHVTLTTGAVNWVLYR